MTNVFRLTLVALFISACNDVAAQACPSDQDLAALIAKAPPCRLIKPQGGAEGTPFYVTSMDPKNTQCQIPNDAFGANLLDQPVTIDYTLDKVPAKLPAANSECISTFQKDGKTTLFVELPSVSSKKNLWIIKKKDGSAIVNVGLLSPSVSKGIAPAKDPDAEASAAPSARRMAQPMGYSR